ncbi:MAG: transposase [Bacteroidales bacterium]|nr:transposase [Bacteroidales bacterium]
MTNSLAINNLNKGQLEFRLVTTDHLSENIWFRDEQDFKVGMNYIAIISLVTGINVLAFILMSNHVHLVLQCSKAAAERFINEYKRRYSQYINKRYGKVEFLRKNSFKNDEVRIDNESLERAIVYTLMNSVAANICINASDYPWGSAGVYFQINKPKGKRLGDLSRKAQKRLLHSKAELPENLIVGEDGYILPESFVSVGFVESVFRTPKRMKYFLDNSSKAKKRLESAELGLATFNDQIVFAAIKDMCRTMFRKRDVHELSAEELSVMIRDIRRRFSADVNQIARLVEIPYSEVVRMLEEF